MKVIMGAEKRKFAKNSTAVGLGNFDGLHLGHRTLVDTLISEAETNELESILYTFTKHPENILRKKLFTPLLTTVGKKIQLLSGTALNYVIFDEFDEKFSRMKPESFVKDVLLDRLGAGLVVAGFDYRFGYMGQGDIELLKEYGKKFGFRVVVIPPVRIGDKKVSSTIIRSFVSEGDMENVRKFLGRYYSVTGEVLDGKHIGRKIGFPTANLIPEEYLVMPRDGVYATKTLYNGELYNSLTNIGRNPTFGGVPETTVETHMLDFDRDIYKSNIEVFFLKKLRNEKKFNNGAELAEQIRRDIQAAREYFELNERYNTPDRSKSGIRQI